ncbi:MAG: AraC family transcriptional regulator [Deltaproteobacteria bacterium]|nr:AraC family transcriptional regulator [Deltaproteobacteria bacterium]
MSPRAYDDPQLDWQESRDVLSALVRLVGLHGVVLATMELGSPWRVTNAEALDPVLHVVTRGSAWIRGDDAASPVALEAGDLVMLPRGGRYELRDSRRGRRAPTVDVPTQQAGLRCSIREGGDGPRTHLTCCAFRFESVSAAPLLNLLPSMVVVRADEVTRGIRAFVGELVRESKGSRVGTEGMVSRLAELVFLGVLRIHFETTGSTDSGLLAAVAHPQIGRALGLVHAALDAPWTVATLASKVGMSRAAFAQLFADKTHESPIRYVQRCRIEEAKRMLTQTPMNLAEIGQRVGYTDPAGFSRAFRREVGISPRDYRRAAGSRANESPRGTSPPSM